MRKWPFEMFIWIAALIALAFTNLEGPHFQLCPIARMGWDWCPGCGIGRSIAAILQGRWADSFDYHVLGLPALGIISWRIWDLGNKYLKITKKEIINF